MVEESPRRGASRRLAPGAAWDGAVIARAVEGAAQERAVAAQNESDTDDTDVTGLRSDEESDGPKAS